MGSERGVTCPFEADVLDAVRTGRWPGRIDDQLLAHLATCTECADAAVVSAALGAECESALAEATLPPASVVWWRAQRRARADAARTAMGPVWSAQLVAMAVVAAGAIGALVMGANWLIARLRAAETLWPSLAAALSVPTSGAPWLAGSVALAVLGALVLTPLALYLAVSDD